MSVLPTRLLPSAVPARSRAAAPKRNAADEGVGVPVGVGLLDTVMEAVTVVDAVGVLVICIDAEMDGV